MQPLTYVKVLYANSWNDEQIMKLSHYLRDGILQGWSSVKKGDLTIHLQFL